MPATLVYNIGDLVSLTPLVQDHRFVCIQDHDLGRMRDAWLHLDDGQVVRLGTGPAPKDLGDIQKIDAQGGLVIPGLVDAHTHPFFGGSRAGEFWQRLSGATYHEIATAGGGIQSTMRSTREASDEELIQSCTHRLLRSLQHGVTTQEIKSGYGRHRTSALPVL